jgi:hypothetical protein
MEAVFSQIIVAEPAVYGSSIASGPQSAEFYTAWPLKGHSPRQQPMGTSGGELSFASDHKVCSQVVIAITTAGDPSFTSDLLTSEEGRQKQPSGRDEC